MPLPTLPPLPLPVLMEWKSGPRNSAMMEEPLPFLTAAKNNPLGAALAAVAPEGLTPGGRRAVGPSLPPPSLGVAGNKGSLLCLGWGAEG